MKNISDPICRLCLRSGIDLINIFDNMKFIERLFKISSLKILDNDNLPTTVCNSCVSKVNDFFEFRSQIIETEKILRQCMSLILDKPDIENRINVNDEDDLQLVCVEEDGTQVFTLEAESSKEDEDSVVVLPIKKDKESFDRIKTKETGTDQEISVIVTSGSNHKIIPLQLLNSIDERSIIKAVKSDIKDAKDENGFSENNENMQENKLKNASMKTDIPNFKIVSCQLCLKQFSDYNELQEHISAHFEGFGYYETEVKDLQVNEDKDICKYCLLRFSDNLQNHIEKDHCNELFVCRHCSDNFENEVKFKEHLRNIHYNLQCNLCTLKSNTYLQLQNHLSSVHYKGTFWCPPCLRAFKDKFDYIVHQRHHLGIKPYRCKFCNEEFVTKTQSKGHELTHEGSAKKVDKFVCKHCGNSFNRNYDLKCHETSAHIQIKKPIICNICLKMFSNLASYKFHSRRHEFGQRFVCKLCGRAYFSNAELQRHEQIHSGIRKYPCSWCENAFMSQPELNRHLKYHTGEKKYKCNQCGKSYYESGHLRIHERTHAGVKPFECSVCTKRFISRPKLFRHFKTHQSNKNAKMNIEKNGNIGFITTTTNMEIPDVENNSQQDTTTGMEIVTEIIDENATSNATTNLKQVMDMVDDSVNNLFGIQMSNGSIVLMENEAFINNDIVYTTEDNVKIEIINSS